MSNDRSVMFNAYPDSMGSRLSDIVEFLKTDRVRGAFGSFYILPSLFNSDIDRGFSLIDYGLNGQLANTEDLDEIRDQGIDLALDFLINHISVMSPQFRDILKNGDESEYRDFFIDWNRFWNGKGEMTDEGYIQPNADLIKDMFFRKPGLPILQVQFPGGRKVPYWNTFYQRVNYETNEYLGQMDLNVESPLVWEYYGETLRKLSAHGAKIVRLDAFAYASKVAGKKNFFNEPETWDILSRVREMADRYNLLLLPEIHASYGEKIHEVLSEKGYMTYDFFLPGLILDAFERKTFEPLKQWINDIREKKINAVNMLGCHDGIPLLDLKGLLPGEHIESLISAVVSRGGHVKDLHGQKNVYYQVNATYYSALGENGRKLLFARAVQMFMPGKPQVWYLDLFAGKNDIEAVRRGGEGGHKEINRTNMTAEQVNAELQNEVVRKQLELIRFRNSFEAFSSDAQLSIISTAPEVLQLRYAKDGCTAELTANVAECAFSIAAYDSRGEAVFKMESK